MYAKQIGGFLSGVNFSICLHEQTKTTKLSHVSGVKTFCHLASHPVLTAHSHSAIACVARKHVSTDCRGSLENGCLL